VNSICKDVHVLDQEHLPQRVDLIANLDDDDVFACPLELHVYQTQLKEPEFARAAISGYCAFYLISSQLWR
jgi:hypothetical protein